MDESLVGSFPTGDLHPVGAMHTILPSAGSCLFLALSTLLAHCQPFSSVHVRIHSLANHRLSLNISYKHSATSNIPCTVDPLSRFAAGLCVSPRQRVTIGQQSPQRPQQRHQQQRQMKLTIWFRSSAGAGLNNVHSQIHSEIFMTATK
jgi:hypothetical protein